MVMMVAGRIVLTSARRSEIDDGGRSSRDYPCLVLVHQRLCPSLSSVASLRRYLDDVS